MTVQDFRKKCCGGSGRKIPGRYKTPLFYIGSVRGKNVFIPVDITEDVVKSAMRKLSGNAGPGGTDLEALQGWPLKFGDHSKKLRISGESFMDWLANRIAPNLCLAAWLHCIIYPEYVQWASGESGANFLLSACWSSQDPRLPTHAKMTRSARYWKRESTGQYTGFNIFGALTLPRKIGNFHLLTQRTPLMKWIKSECCGQFAIYGCMELVLFLTSAITITRLYWESGMVRPLFSIVGKTWHKRNHWIWLPTAL